MGLEEKWLPIEGYNGKYEVSNTGKVRNITTQKCLKGQPTKDGYLRVRLFDDNTYRSRMIHCLVAEAFIPLPDEENKYEVDHKDNDVTHNSVDNLQWLTHIDNLEKSFMLNHQRRQKRTVYQFDLSGKLIQCYESINEAFRQTGIRHISECAIGRRRTAGGYIWSYNQAISRKE